MNISEYKYETDDEQQHKPTMTDYLMTYGWAILALLIIAAFIYTQFNGGGQ